MLRDERIFVPGAEERGVTIPEAFAAKLGALGTTLVGETTYATTAMPMDPVDADHQEHRVLVLQRHGCGGRVDRAGQVKVLRFAAAADVGQEINPHHCTQQIEGGALVALGATLYEWMNVDQGQVTNASFLDYQLPSLKDVPPEMHAVAISVPHPDGPFGAKGVGESFCALRPGGSWQRRL